MCIRDRTRRDPEIPARKTGLNLTEKKVNKLISIYSKYKHIFSDMPGKVRNYQCKLKFKEPVEFRRKSYPIAHSLKEAVRSEINKMMADDIIEYNHSPYHNTIVAIPKKNTEKIS